MSGKEYIGVTSRRDTYDFFSTIFSRGREGRKYQRMTSKVITCGPDDSIAEILYLMQKNQVRHLPVVDGEQLLGIISIRDVTENWLTTLEQENQKLRDAVGEELRRSA